MGDEPRGVRRGSCNQVIHSTDSWRRIQEKPASLKSSSSSETNTESEITPRESENSSAQVEHESSTKVQLLTRLDQEAIAFLSRLNGLTIVGLDLEKGGCGVHCNVDVI